MGRLTKIFLLRRSDSDLSESDRQSVVCIAESDTMNKLINVERIGLPMLLHIRIEFLFGEVEPVELVSAHENLRYYNIII